MNPKSLTMPSFLLTVIISLCVGGDILGQQSVLFQAEKESNRSQSQIAHRNGVIANYETPKISRQRRSIPSGIPAVAGLAGILALVIPTIMMSSSPIERQEDEINENERIFRGVEPPPHAWPWAVKVKTVYKSVGKKSKRSCGGALITDRFVLTARHCVSWDATGELVPASHVTTWVGSHGSRGEDGVRMSVARIIARNDYQQPACASGVWCPPWAFWSHVILTNDIAMLELTTAVSLSDKILPIKIGVGYLAPGSIVWVGGWGMDGVTPASTLQLAEMIVMKEDFRECSQQMAPSKICAVGLDVQGPCPGDSGSPLVQFGPQGPILVGLVSNGAENCRAGLPGIYTRVSEYLDWIDASVRRFTPRRRNLFQRRRLNFSHRLLNLLHAN